MCREVPADVKSITCTSPVTALPTLAPPLSERLPLYAWARCVSAFFAVGVPPLLAFNISPSVTFLNQALAILGWGFFVWVLAFERLPRSAIAWPSGLWALLMAMALMCLAPLAAAMTSVALPWGLALSSAGLMAAAGLLAMAAAVTQATGRGDQAFQAFCAGLLVAGLLSVVVASIQYFAPELADGTWVARSASAGRVGANLRQPNHLSSLLLWALVALVWLHQMRARQPHGQGRGERGVTVLFWVALVFGVVLTVSRTGTVCIVLLALWGVVDRRLTRFARVMLWLTPLVYILCWVGVAEWAQASVHAFAGDDQMHKSDLSSSRFGIWANALVLLANHPWLGVGWGEFNFAWTLTPFPGRPVAFFDHTHNLPLQLVVELGIPLGGTIMALLLWALWRGGMACWRVSGQDSPTARAAFVMVLMMGVHSMLEYPLWYAYFLLPTAFAFGVCVGRGSAVDARPPAAEKSLVPVPSRWLLAGAALMVAGGAVSVVDYMRVAAIFSSSAGAAPLPVRIAEGRRSWFFAHHADYAAATTVDHPVEVMDAFERAPHYLLDTRLMLAWAHAYAESGDVERARYLAERLKEFRNPQSDEFFAECNQAHAPGDLRPFQCTPSTQTFTYEDFRLR